MLINISKGDVIDWSPYSTPQGKYSHSELRWKWYNINGTVEISASINQSIWWHGVGMASLLLQFGNSILTNLWKLASAFHPLKVFEGKLNIKDDKYTLSFRLNQSPPFMACVPLPYLLLEGPVQWHPNNYSLTYEVRTVEADHISKKYQCRQNFLSHQPTPK